MKSIRTLAVGPFVLCGFLLLPSVARAQYGATPFHDPATGETYHIEASVGLWNPPPDLTIASEQFGLAGTRINAATDLGIQQKRVTELRLVLRPARKHKFTANYLPIHYNAQSTVKKDFVFNGIQYGLNLAITTDLVWNTWLLGYEYDFLYKDRWFAGLLLQAKLTDVQVILDSPITRKHDATIACVDQPDDVSHACAKAPIPNIGGIVRVYVVPNISITGSMVGMSLPSSIDPDYRAHYFDFDVYGTVNFNSYVGAQIGYRNIDVGYVVKKDEGSFLMKGLYFGGVVRY